MVIEPSAGYRFPGGLHTLVVSVAFPAQILCQVLLMTDQVRKNLFCLTAVLGGCQMHLCAFDTEISNFVALDLQLQNPGRC